MTREHSQAKRRALRLAAQLRGSGMHVVISHGDGCGIHLHKVCSCLPIIAVHDAEGEVYLVGDDREMHRIERQ
jgi:hypothetical protein